MAAYFLKNWKYIMDDKDAEPDALDVAENQRKKAKLVADATNRVEMCNT